MNFKLQLSEFYYKSTFYLAFLLVQILISIGLVIFILSDFKNNIRLKGVYYVEIILAGLMIIDILVYQIISSCTVNPIIILEWCLILSYVVVLYLLEVYGLGQTDEIIELTLLICRLIFVVLRSLLIIINLHRKRDQGKRNTILMDKEFNMQSSNEFETTQTIDKLDDYAQLKYQHF